MKDILHYKWKYFLSFIFKYFYSLSNNSEVDVCFVTHTSTKGWILDAKCKRLARYMKLRTMVYYSSKFRRLPKARGYFFAHFKYYAKAVRYNPKVLRSKTMVLFTHPNWSKAYSPEHVGYILNKAGKIICLNSRIVKELIKLGIQREKLVVYHMASDPEMFTWHKRGNGCVGICMAYYKRKNPDLLLSIIKGMPNTEFILIGIGWDQYNNYQELISQNNFKYYDNIPYEEYPGLYHKMDVFLSTSDVEGGPVPLLEAMLSNVIPVVSDTGWARDIIEHGKNGYIFPVSENSDRVIKLIRQAFACKEDVRHYVIQHNWENYSQKLEEFFG